MLSHFIENNSYAIVAGYNENCEIIAVLGGIIYHESSIEIIFPKMNPFKTGQKISFHLDNRTGLEEYDINLKVYRVSVKAVVLRSEKNTIFVEPVEYKMNYGNKTIDTYTKTGYTFPFDKRNEHQLLEAKTSLSMIPDISEHENKLGVLITKAIERPHTTVMAFLSSDRDDIYIISHNDSFKSKNIHRDSECVFAIDHRASFRFEKAIEWNYTLIRGTLREVSRNNPLFDRIQTLFVDKNPWELVFFTDSTVEMYQLEPTSIIYPDNCQN